MKLIWKGMHLEYLDPKTKSCEQEIQRNVQLQSVTNQLPDAFTDTKKVTKSHIPVANTPARIEIPDEKEKSDEIVVQRKRGRPFGSKDLKSRKLKKQESAPNDTQIEKKDLIGQDGKKQLRQS
ncbi:uncharacterized protein LOC130828534 [Amaranthus tricolor]|uniref:uncharacterized protein LOC130828534 n=1 Tax=Amaranthus tricolor TaxID=29722 RepID=UPI0025879D83|nr:uncharacterized protein LOC130828534 [Amaranthus tricolor]